MRLSSLHPRTRRAGLTLVEMLVALALAIFIMSILSEAFVKGLEAFGNLKALGDMEQRLRTAANILRRDLQANHFENSKRLSECTVTGKAMPVLDGLRATTYSPNEALVLEQQLKQYGFKPPAQGFFSIEEWPNRPGVTPRATSFFEGQDSNSGRTSYRDQYDVLHFTSRLEGNDPSKFFYGKVRAGSPLDGVGMLGGVTRYDSAGNNMFTSQAAELLYFVDTDDTANLPGVGNAGGPVQTFNLYRQARLLIPDQYSNGDIPVCDTTYGNTAAENKRFFDQNDVSAFRDATTANVTGMFFNTMSTVQHRARRFPQFLDPAKPYAPKALVPSGAFEGSDILLTNVISFDVKVFDPFAYKIPLGAIGGGATSGRGAYVDIGDVFNNVPGTLPAAPTAACFGDALIPVFGGPLNTVTAEFFDTGTNRQEGIPGGTNLAPTSGTHRYPITSIQITIRVFEPKSKQTRQITIIQDM